MPADRGGIAAAFWRLHLFRIGGVDLEPLAIKAVA
jgi:hypothetical protein